MDGKEIVAKGGVPAFGAPDPDPPSKEELDAELARANLLRMRGDYKGAVDQCLHILKLAPENLDAHTLLGDIHSENGDLAQSEQWYDLALELDPKSQSLQTKLDSVRERAQHKEIAETAEQLGLPTDGPRMAIYSAAVVIFIVIIGIAAYLMGQRHPVAKRSPQRISINAPGMPDEQSNTAGGDPDESAATEPVTSTGAGYLPQDDRSLAVNLSQHDPLGSHIMSVLSDPRTKTLTINYSVHADDDVRKIGAELARSSFEQMADAMTITVRGSREDKLVYVADVTREKLNDAVTSNENQGGGSDGWISGALSYEWTPTTTASTPPPSSTVPAAATPSSPPTTTSTTSGAPASPAPITKETTGGTAGSSTTGT